MPEIKIKAPKGRKTISDVFIIESLTPEDESAHRSDGIHLAEILRLAGKTPKYHHIHTAAELRLLVPLFKESGYRYLHLSCHGSPGKIHLTLDEVTFAELGVIFKKTLALRRVIASACSVGTPDFVKALASESKGLQSVVAPKVDIRFDHSAIIWAALYVSLFDEDTAKVKHDGIKKRLADLAQLFPRADANTTMKFLFAGYHPNVDDWEYSAIDEDGVHPVASPQDVRGRGKPAT